MSFSVSQLSDLEAIRGLRITFGHALDRREWSLMPDIFAANIDADLSAFGVPAGPLSRDAFVAVFQHSFRHSHVRTVQTYSNARIQLDGDEATCVCDLHGWHKGEGFAGGDLFELRARYKDHMRRHPEGWRIVATQLEVIDIAGNRELVS